MDTQEVIKKRRCVRVFKPEAVPVEAIEKIIDCARLAPTAINIQPWEFVAVTNAQTLKGLGALADHGKFIAKSPCCIAVFCADTKYYLEDGCAATENILLAACDLGLSACWVAGDKKSYTAEINKLLKVPDNFKLVSLIPLGYAAMPPSAPVKRALKDVLHWEAFGSH